MPELPEQPEPTTSYSPAAETPEDAGRVFASAAKDAAKDAAEKPEEPTGIAPVPPRLIARGVAIAVFLGILVWVMATHRNDLRRPIMENSFPQTETLGIPGAEIPVASKPAGASATGAATTTKATTTAGTTGTLQSGAVSSGTAAGTTGTTASSTSSGAKEETKSPITGPIDNAYVVVFLSRKIVALCVGKEYIRVWRSAGVPADTTRGKMRHNDGLAPIGDYYVCARKSPEGQLPKVLLSYPSARDAKLARQARIIDDATLARIEAVKFPDRPPLDTAMGGAVIEGTFAAGAATTGNITLSAADMKELYLATKIGTPVRIRP